MAVQRIFSVYDSKTQSWGPPFFALHLGQAMRMWSDLVNDGQSLVSKHPADFALYDIGEYDDSNASITPRSPVQMLQTASEARIVPQALPMDLGRGISLAERTN